MNRLPLVAIVGAPNVGKSTLFNRLVGSRAAIVTDEPGVTRDRIFGNARGADRAFRVVDTGGVTPDGSAPLSREIESQARAALHEASLVLFVVDVRAGLTGADRDVAAWLRRQGVATILVANKADTPALELVAHEAHRLGLGTPIPVSAEHGLGLDDLLAAVDATLAPAFESAGDQQAGEEESPRPIAVAIIGRPNVGKSSLVNRLLGEERSIVGERPGTTRDAVDTLLESPAGRFLLIDTAGLRRRGRVRQTAESLAVTMARRAIRRADVVVLVLDATQPITAQDTHIAGLAHDGLRPVVLAVNKWDLVSSREQAAKAWGADVLERLRFIKETPTVFVSALSGQRVGKVLEHVAAAHACAGVRIKTPELNRWLRDDPDAERARSGKRVGVRLFYAVQTGVHPQRFTIFCSDARRVHFSTRRRIENGLRERFALGCAPVRLLFRGRREVKD